jgi:hypothetical protein
MPAFVESVVATDLPQIPGLVAAIGQFDEGGKRHALLVAYDPATAPIDTDIDVATVADIKIGVGYDIDPVQKIRSSYRVIQGTLRLTAACAGGVTGRSAAPPSARSTCSTTSHPCRTAARRRSPRPSSSSPPPARKCHDRRTTADHAARRPRRGRLARPRFGHPHPRDLG